MPDEPFPRSFPGASLIYEEKTLLRTPLYQVYTQNGPRDYKTGERTEPNKGQGASSSRTRLASARPGFSPNVHTQLLLESPLGLQGGERGRGVTMPGTKEPVALTAC